jgi:hypothetical protein
MIYFRIFLKVFIVPFGAGQAKAASQASIRF